MGKKDFRKKHFSKLKNQISKSGISTDITNVEVNKESLSEVGLIIMKLSSVNESDREKAAKTLASADFTNISEKYLKDYSSKPFLKALIECYLVSNNTQLKTNIVISIVNFIVNFNDSSVEDIIINDFGLVSLLNQSIKSILEKLINKETKEFDVTKEIKFFDYILDLLGLLADVADNKQNIFIETIFILCELIVKLDVLVHKLPDQTVVTMFNTLAELFSLKSFKEVDTNESIIQFFSMSMKFLDYILNNNNINQLSSQNKSDISLLNYPNSIALFVSPCASSMLYLILYSSITNTENSNYLKIMLNLIPKCLLDSVLNISENIMLINSRLFEVLDDKEDENEMKIDLEDNTQDKDTTTENKFEHKELSKITNIINSNQMIVEDVINEKKHKKSLNELEEQKIFEELSIKTITVEFRLKSLIHIIKFMNDLTINYQHEINVTYNNSSAFNLLDNKNNSNNNDDDWEEVDEESIDEEEEIISNKLKIAYQTSEEFLAVILQFNEISNNSSVMNVFNTLLKLTKFSNENTVVANSPNSFIIEELLGEIEYTSISLISNIIFNFSSVIHKYVPDYIALVSNIIIEKLSIQNIKPHLLGILLNTLRMVLDYEPQIKKIIQITQLFEIYKNNNTEAVIKIAIIDLIGKLCYTRTDILLEENQLICNYLLDLFENEKTDIEILAHVFNAFMDVYAVDEYNSVLISSNIINIMAGGNVVKNFLSQAKQSFKANNIDKEIHSYCKETASNLKNFIKYKQNIINGNK